MRDRFFRYVDEQVKAREEVLRKEMTAGMEHLSELDFCSSLTESFRRHRDFCMARAILLEQLAHCEDEHFEDSLCEIADSIGGQFYRASLKWLGKSLEVVREKAITDDIEAVADGLSAPEGFRANIWFKMEWLVRNFLAEVSDTTQLSEARGNDLAARAICEKLETGKISVRCPRCFGRPKVVIMGCYQERISAKCSCGYVCETQYGI